MLGISQGGASGPANPVLSPADEASRVLAHKSVVEKKRCVVLSGIWESEPEGRREAGCRRNPSPNHPRPSQRKSLSPVPTKNQSNSQAIAKLRADNARLSEELLLENKFGVRPSRPGDALRSAALQAEADALARRVQLEQRHVLLLQRALGEGRARLAQTRAGAGSLNSARQQGACLAVAQSLLESRLARLKARVSGAEADNRAIRGRVDSLRRGRLALAAAASSVERELAQAKEELAGRLAAAREAEARRALACREAAAVKTSAERQRAAHEAEWRRLGAAADEARRDIERRRAQEMEARERRTQELLRSGVGVGISIEVGLSRASVVVGGGGPGTVAGGGGGDVGGGLLSASSTIGGAPLPSLSPAATATATVLGGTGRPTTAPTAGGGSSLPSAQRLIASAVQRVRANGSGGSSSGSTTAADHVGGVSTAGATTTTTITGPAPALPPALPPAHLAGPLLSAEAALERLRAFRAAFDFVQRATGAADASSLARAFEAAEDEALALFAFSAEEDVEHSGGACDQEGEEEEEEGEGDNDAAPLLSATATTTNTTITLPRRDVQQARALAAEAALQSARAESARLCKGIHAAFIAAGCGRLPMAAVAVFGGGGGGGARQQQPRAGEGDKSDAEEGDNSAVTESNVLACLGVVEQRCEGLLRELAAAAPRGGGGGSGGSVAGAAARAAAAAAAAAGLRSRRRMVGGGKREGAEGGVEGEEEEERASSAPLSPLRAGGLAAATAPPPPPGSGSALLPLTRAQLLEEARRRLPELLAEAGGR